MKRLYASIVLVISTVLFFVFGFLILQFISTSSSALGGFIYMLLSISSVLIWLGIFLYSDSKNKLPWLFIIAIFPIVGVIAYLMIGHGFKETMRFKKRLKELGPDFVFKVQTFKQAPTQSLSEVATSLVKLNEMTNQTGISFHTQTKILTNGDQKFPALLDALRSAKSFIFLEYYIFNSDEIGWEIINILIEKAQEGVEVRVLYDPLGTTKKMTKSAVSKMRAGGVVVAQFDPVLIPFLTNKVNHRNHRKIVVVDGRVGVTGGINIGDEYLHRAPRYPFWRDSSILLEGEAVYHLSVIFAGDWFFATGERLEDEKYFVLYPVKSSGAVQIIDSGPQSSIANIKQCFFRMIMSAKKSVYLITPYLIPDVDILSALKNASLSGIDVRIIVPGFPDRVFVYLATQSYFEQLLEVGVRIFTYDAVFCHSKVMVIDEEIASIGTTNMDIRSFYLNFEVNVVLYETESIQQLLNDFNIDLSRSTELFYEEWKQRSVLVRSAQSLAQLFSPIM
ncbi:MAG TPA: cardiolipin synthase [Firmicutes bacterium]|nr:cardiolipin synthase [Bacillota bacterium]